MRFAPTRGWTIRAAAWAFFGGLIAVRMFVGLLDLGVQTENLIVWVVLLLVPMALALAACVVAALKFEGLERRFWRMLAIATACLLLSESYWTWFAARVDFHGPAIPAVFEVFQLTAVVLFFWLVASMTRIGGTSKTAHVRLLLDVLAALTIGVGAIYWLWTFSLFNGIVGGGWKVALIAAVYPAVGAVLFGATAAVAVGWRSARWRSWERLVAASLAIFAAGLFIFPSWYAGLLGSIRPVPDGWFTSVLGFGYYLLVMALVYRITAVDEAKQVEHWSVPAAGPVWLGIVYPMALVVSLPFLGWAALEAGGQPGGLAIVVLAVFLAMILVVRSWLGSIERSVHRSMAVTDPVTGLFNHRYLHEHLADEIANAAANSRQVALVCADIDDFQRFNAIRGHAFGDEVLVGVARVLSEECPENATACRPGSDDFTVILPTMGCEDAVAFVKRVQARIERELGADGMTVILTAGVALYPDHGTRADELIANAIASQQVARGSDLPVTVFDSTRVEVSDPAERLARMQQRAQRTTVRALAAAVDSRDPDSAHHSENVSELATALAQVLGFSEEHVESVGIAARLHDVGRIGIRDDVLYKSGPLTDEERLQIESHPVLGERILAPAHLDAILPAVRHHHERWDGEGYPDGLAGPQIPLDARILAVCDAFERMTSSRGSRTALSLTSAIAEVERGSGSLFDPDVASAFNRMVARLHGQTMRERIRSSGVSRSDY